MKKIFTLLVAFLAIAGNAVWGQETSETKFGLKVTGPEGSFVFTNGYDPETEKGNNLLQIQKGGVVITNEKSDTPAKCKITINCTTSSEPEKPTTVTLDNVHIQAEGVQSVQNATPIAILTGSNITLILKGENIVESANTHLAGYDKGIIAVNGKASLTIKGEEGSKLTLINHSLHRNAIGGPNATINIESGTIVTNYGSIGGTDSEVNISEGVKIEMTNPEAGIYAKTTKIEGAEISVTYNDKYKGTTANGKGISLAATSGARATLNMSDTKFSVIDSRSTKKAIGIEGTNGYNATISDCDIDMDVATGLYSVAQGSFAIKGNSIVDISATGNAIDISKQMRSTVDISEESVVLLSSNGENAAGIYVGYMGNMTTSENGNAYVVADTKEGIVYKELIGEDKDKLKDTDRTAWKGIVFERDENLDGILSGYVYDDITMQTKAFELKDNYHLIYCNPNKGKLTIGGNGALQNNGHIFIAYDSQEQNIKNTIEGNGAYHYEVFYDESVNVPDELKDNLKDAILSDELIRKMSHPNAEKRTEMIFGESGKTITLSIDEKKYPGYTFTFKAKTEEDGNEIEVSGNSFTMPAEAVRIYDIKIEKKYIATVSDEIDNTQGGVTIAIGEETTNRAEFAENDEVNLIVSEEPGYVLDRLYYKNEKGIEVEIDDVKFFMPASDVTIYATFKPESQGGDDEGDDDSTSGAYKKRFRLYLANEDYFPKDCEEDYELEGLVLFSRHDKKYTHAGGSFTIWYEQFGEPNVGNYRVFWSKTAKGEYEEVKFDEVSEYFQIRDVHSNVFVKLYYETGFPVSNETIEATEARAYAQPNKIVVITPEPTEVQIISMAGAVVATAQVAGQQEFANLTEGVYIVRMGDSIVKLQVRN